MSDTFNLCHELVMLYLSKKDFSDLTPSQLLDEYKKAYDEIKKHNAEAYSGRWFS